jgi:hypothetical protein
MGIKRDIQPDLFDHITQQQIDRCIETKGAFFMQVLLRKSEEKRDLQCRVCGQGFRIYWERTSLEEQGAMRAIILKELDEHHALDRTASAHPEAPFNVPSWQGLPQFSGAALLGGLSTIRRAAPQELDLNIKH